MLINATRPEEVRAAVLSGRALEQLEFEVRDAGLLKGNIYKGVIANVEPSLNACFVDFGAEKQGFLPFDEIAPSCWHEKGKKDGKKKPRIEDVMRRRREIIVQVVKDATGNKGAALTTRVSLAGRYMVLMPLDDSRGVSRKVSSDAERKKIKELAAGLKIPEEFGFIVRTAGLKRTKTDLNRDGTQLVRLWKNVLKEAKTAKSNKTALLHEDRDLIIRMLRDYLTADTTEVFVDTPAAHAAASAWFKAVMPRSSKVLTHYEGGIPLFDAYGVEEQIEAIFSRRVDLPSGGYILVDPTEALISIDVNSGRSTKQRSQEETALHTNLEAAAEVARQLRLRDLGGLIVIDFIDMVTTGQNRQVEKVLKDVLKKDKARTYVSKISENGLCEVNRQRIKQAIQLQTHIDCPSCEGRGIVPSPEFAVRGLLRRIQAKAAAGKVDKVVLGLNPEIALQLLNKHRRDLSRIEDDCGILVKIDSRPGLIASKIDIRWLSITQLSPVERAQLEGHREIILARGQELKNDEKLPAPLPEYDPDAEEAEEAAERAQKEPGDKKKRRRRRRRGRERDERQEETDGEGEAKADAPASEGTGDAEAKADGGEPTAKGEGEDENAERPRRRRRRRRGRGRSRSSENEEGERTEGENAEDEAKEGEAAAEGSSQEETDPDLSRSQKRRRRRKRRRPSEADTEAPAPVVIEADGLDDVDAAADTLEFGPDGELITGDEDVVEPAAVADAEAEVEEVAVEEEEEDATEEAPEPNGASAEAMGPASVETQPVLPAGSNDPPGQLLVAPPADSLFE